MENIACFQELAQSAAEHMLRSLFCLCPRGDTPSTSRFYDAIAAGCIPVVISDSFEMPFTSTIDYKGAFVKVLENDMLQDPAAVAKRLVSFDAKQIAAMQSRLRSIAVELDYRDTTRKRTATHLLEAASSQTCGVEA